MRIVAHSNTCGGGDCPTIYEAEDGTLYVQGYKVTEDERSQVKLPNGEELVRIDASLLANLKF